MKKKNVIVIGGGPAGIEIAQILSNYSCNVTLFEKEPQVGGQIKRIDKLFPDFIVQDEMMQKLISNLEKTDIQIHTDTEIKDIEQIDNIWHLKTNKEEAFTADAVVLATGFKTFDPKYKEELGYGIYPGVITTLEFEDMLKAGKIQTSAGEEPRRIAFLNCVGSRDEKVGNHYCSRVCCINAVKQSIETKELLPNAEVFCFYMDLRMSGQFYEELYRKSQEKHGVNYIRGRISEASSTFDHRIQIKSEDTLAGLPLKMTVDLLVLMIGVEASEGTTNLSAKAGILGEYGFAKSLSLHLKDNLTKKEGLFLAGACKRPSTLREVIADARAAAFEVVNYLKMEING